MQRFQNSFVLLTAVSGLLSVPLAAQQQEGKDAFFRSDTRLVLLHATVTDNKGRLITDLGRGAFTVYENGSKQLLKLFRREDVPISVGLVIDNSASMRNKKEKVAAAALAFVKASNSEDEAFIVNFNDDPVLSVPFTSDVAKMEEGLDKINTVGGTAMRDAVTMAINYVKQKGKRDKKVLLVISDGDDTMSANDNTIEKVVALAQQNEVLVYTIGLLNEEEKDAAKRAKRALEQLAEVSGGAAYFPDAADEVEPLALSVAHEIRNQYILAYSPSAQSLDGSYRKIKVEAKGQSRLQVRTRTGYYATPDAKPAAPAAPPRR